MNRNAKWATVERALAAQALGCFENGRDGGQFFGVAGERISDTRARRLFRQGWRISVPNAGAGSYGDVLERLGFNAVTVDDSSSAAGNWCFKVRGGLVFQVNRYPLCGFDYSLIRLEKNAP